MKKIAFIIILLLSIYQIGFTQPGSKYITGKIYIDSRLPNISLGNLIRYKDKTAKLDDFFNKIVILDFWFTHCGDCIAQFPKEDSLQKEFGDDIQIIPVAYESKEVVNTFLNKWESLHHMKLSMPFIVGDSLLTKMFANPYDPHFAWIAQDKRVIGITSQYSLNKEFVQGLINETKPLKMWMKLDGSIKSGRMDEKKLYEYYNIKPPK